LSDLLGGAAPKAVIYTALANLYSFVIFFISLPGPTEREEANA